MTTNVFDGPAGVLATDSRWSVQQGRWLVYVDDTAFWKLELAHDAAFMFAGKGRRIQEWKDWIRTDPQDDSEMPDPEGISVCLVKVSTKEVRFAERQDIVKDGAYFAGSGSRYAFTCWAVNKDAQKSIGSAMKVDPATGGEVKFFDVVSKKHNLTSISAEASVDAVHKAITTRGIVMDIGAKRPGAAPFKLSDIAASDTELRDLQAKLESGELAPEAPCDGMYSEWTADQKTRLKGAISDVFGWKK